MLFFKYPSKKSLSKGWIELINQVKYFPKGDAHIAVNQKKDNHVGEIKWDLALISFNFL